MVVSLKPGRFYGSGLPRPWFHADVKFNDERVDPPPSVLDPLLCWAREAHWSMGGLGFKRHRLQGRIEGSIKKLRARAQKIAKTHRFETKKRQREAISTKKNLLLAHLSEVEEEEAPGIGGTPSPRRSRQRRRGLTIPDEVTTSDSHDDHTAKQKAATAESSRRPRSKSARKLGDEFDRVASRSTTQQLFPESDVPLPVQSAAGAVSSPRPRAPRPPIKGSILHRSAGGSPGKLRLRAKEVAMATEANVAGDSAGRFPRPHRNRSPRS